MIASSYSLGAADDPPLNLPAPAPASSTDFELDDKGNYTKTPEAVQAAQLAMAKGLSPEEQQAAYNRALATSQGIAVSWGDWKRGWRPKATDYAGAAVVVTVLSAIVYFVTRPSPHAAGVRLAHERG